MKHYRLDRPLPAYSRAVALGFFDGVHLGHRAVIAQNLGVERAGTSGFSPLVSAVLTFCQPAWAVKKDAPLLTSEHQRERILETLGVEEWIEADFEQLRDLSPEQFVGEILDGCLGARRVSCGDNYRFGRGGAGDAALLRHLCRQRGIDCVIAPPVQVEGETVSASRIRRRIEAGDPVAASRMLGRPFTIDFPVVAGRQVGRTLGAPTINQPLPEHFVKPRFGVYASFVVWEGRARHAVTNIGVHPTFGEAQPVAETYIPGFDGDLYGREVPVSLIRFLRPEQAFADVAQLREQIAADEKEARRMVVPQNRRTRAILFDFDDTLQSYQAVFDQFSEGFMEKYFPGLDPAEKGKRRRFMRENNQRGYMDFDAYIRLLKDTWDWKDAPDSAQLLREYALRYASLARLSERTADLLRCLRQRGYRLGVVTNGPSVMQHHKLDVCGIRPLLDAVVVSGEEGVHKPDPELFRRAALRLGIPCENCAFVGDHPVNDMQGARAAGMRPIQLETDWGVRAEGVTLIKNLEQLLEIFP